LEAGHQPLCALAGSSSRLSMSPADLPTGPAYALEPGRPTPGWPSLLRPPIAILISTGLLTGFPSTTRLRLALGTDLPCADYRGAGNLGLAAGKFVHSPDRYSCQHSHFRYLQPASQQTFTGLRNAPLPNPPPAPLTGRQGGISAASVDYLSPVISAARADSTSELLRFLSRMAASKPTSWLSRPSHLVCH
jgi:hypothetical protein